MTLLFVWLAPTPASAHAGTSAPNTNYLIKANDIGIDGVAVRMVEAGDRIELRNRSDQDVIVLGYAQEPYLRIGPAGVFENTSSASVLFNTQQDIQNLDLNAAPKSIEPEWRRISKAPLARWRDHRWDIAVATNTLPSQWSVPLLTASGPAAIEGSISYVAGPNPLVKYLAALSLLLLSSTTILFHRFRSRAITFWLGTLFVCDVAHTFASLSTVARLRDTVSYLDVLLVSLVAWLCLGAAIRRVISPRAGSAAGLFFALLGAVVIAVVGGLGELSILDHSQIPVGIDAELVRWLVVGSLGVGTGVALASAYLIRSEHISHRSEGESDEDTQTIEGHSQMAGDSAATR